MKCPQPPECLTSGFAPCQQQLAEPQQLEPNPIADSQKLDHPELPQAPVQEQGLWWVEALRGLICLGLIAGGYMAVCYALFGHPEGKSDLWDNAHKFRLGE